MPLRPARTRTVKVAVAVPSPLRNWRSDSHDFENKNMLALCHGNFPKMLLEEKKGPHRIYLQVQNFRLIRIVKQSIDVIGWNP